MHTELFPGINWVGGIDWNVRDFHSFHTIHGATYNSYLILDTEVALIDTVKKTFFEDHIANISKHVDPSKIKYIICNHAEPDHSSAFPYIMQSCVNATIVTNKKCKDILSSYYPQASNWQWKLVSTGDTLSLGNRTLKFVETPMVHWPDSMFTYVEEDKLLFSMDAFGQHLSSAARFADLLDMDLVMTEAKKYYANIVLPYGNFVLKAFDFVKDLEVKMIAPSHGVIWRKDLHIILDAYKRWASGLSQPRVAVIYDSMWNSTGAMAEAINDGATDAGAKSSLIHVRYSDITDVATNFIDTAAFAFGSSTLNSNLMPTAASVLTYLKGLRPSKKIGFAFGSFGWAGKGGPEQVEDYLKQSNIEIVRPVLKCSYRPTQAVLDECYSAGKLLAELALSNSK